MASESLPKRIGRPLNSLTHTDAHEEALIFSHPPYPTEMSYQTNGAEDGIVYTPKTDDLSESNENNTEQLIMDSHCPLRQGDIKSIGHGTNECLSQRDLGIWGKSWKLNYANTSTHTRPITSGDGSQEGQYQPTSTPTSSCPQCSSPLMTTSRGQLGQVPFCQNWQSTSISDGVETSPGDGSIYPPFEWQITSGADVLPLAASALGELERCGANTEPQASGYLVSEGITGCMEQNETGYYPYCGQNMPYPNIPYSGSQSYPWTDVSCSNVICIPAQHPSSSWDMNKDSHSTDHGFYCGPESPSSSALSSGAAPDVSLTATNPKSLVRIESNTYPEEADIESSSEWQSRASSSTDADIASRFTLNSGSDEDHAGRKGYRIYSHRNDKRDAFLIECKLAGMSYKEIKEKGNFTVAESTLRGRFRSLTKKKELRVRKPGWQDSDLRLLCEAVRRFAEPHITPDMGEELLPPKISWKQVGDYIWMKGGSYHFGNATCKKKWAELQRNHAYVQNVVFNRAF
ncbi:hypothetical protein McanCB56680_000263 [Microsporum canis]|uniref:Myb-like domain-containing protein n=1 Tax=Arthroderma otae (strain ATCC MYA-4605 / CBS 113480) TaxID=554155 RepID=C5FX67_ARTOC|nr:conserved hypothetical protein [Microsporum canis CBS 113480]EEQ34907.1 conserved hypothetical protein [Microsporum canis CBS 113480]